MARWVFAQLFRMSRGCGKLPLFAAAALVLSARVAPLLLPKPEPAVLVHELPADFDTVDQVLARRAPGLGLIMREQLAVAISEEARRASYDPLLILAIIDVESDFLESAVSSVGAKGLMQIRPSTLQWWAKKQGLRLSAEEVSKDPALCVRLGVRYLRSLHDRFGKLDLALMAYNAGPARISQASREGDLERYRFYPSLVQRDFRRFREGIGLDGEWALALRAPRASLEGERR